MPFHGQATVKFWMLPDALVKAGRIFPALVFKRSSAAFPNSLGGASVPVSRIAFLFPLCFSGLGPCLVPKSKIANRKS
jgi:hypothetical protein